MSFIFDRNHLFELNEFLHDAYLKNNENNRKITIQNEQLLEKLQDILVLPPMLQIIKW